MTYLEVVYRYRATATEKEMRAVDAIREASNRNGKITITVERDNAQLSLQEEPPDVHAVRSFRVLDNGIGMTEAHFYALKGVV